MEHLKALATFIGILVATLFMSGLIALMVWWKVSVWQECRHHDSFLYCVQIMGR